MCFFRKCFVVAACFAFLTSCSAKELDAATCDQTCNAQISWFWASQQTLAREWYGAVILATPHAQCVANHESRFVETAQNPVSTASGLFGFLDTTWVHVSLARGRPDLAALHAREAVWYEQAANFQWLADREGDAPWENMC